MENMPNDLLFVEIYTLSDPRNGEIRYVGKAVSAVARLKTHIRDARRRDTPLYRWINKLARDGVIPSVSVIDTCSPDDWREREISAIADERGRNPRLLNVADGGDEPHCPPDVRVSNARSVANAVHSNPERKKLWHRNQKLSLRIFKQIAAGEVSDAHRRLLLCCMAMGDIQPESTPSSWRALRWNDELLGPLTIDIMRRLMPASLLEFFEFPGEPA
jgi:hypothetical protein